MFTSKARNHVSALVILKYLWVCGDAGASAERRATLANDYCSVSGSRDDDQQTARECT